MTCSKRCEANRANALRSTGPRTPEGRARSSTNALRHGLRAVAIVTPLESRREWEGHRDAVLDDLAPVGYVETLLAVRAAELFWRLRRAGRAEAGAVTRGVESERRFKLDGNTEAEVTERLEDGAATLEALSKLRFQQNGDEPVTDEEAETVAVLVLDDDAEALGTAPVGGWTVGALRAVVGRVAVGRGIDSTKALAVAMEEVGASIGKWREGLEEYRRRILEVDVPSFDTFDRIGRYEAGLSRELTRTLHELERLQARRAGLPVLPPAALDVTVSGPENGNRSPDLT